MRAVPVLVLVLVCGCAVGLAGPARADSVALLPAVGDGVALDDLARIIDQRVRRGAEKAFGDKLQRGASTRKNLDDAAGRGLGCDRAGVFAPGAVLDCVVQAGVVCNAETGGPHELVVSADGFAAATFPVVVESGAAAAVDATLTPAHVAARPPAPPRRRRPRGPPLAAFIAGGATAAAGVVAVVVGLMPRLFP